MHLKQILTFFLFSCLGSFLPVVIIAQQDTDIIVAKNKLGNNDILSIGFVRDSIPFQLPFEEDWSGGSFEATWWNHDDCENWIININEGNPAPSAEFDAGDSLANYSCSIQSYYINGEGFIDGDIFLYFDLKLEDNEEGGTESLIIAVEDTSGWYFIQEYSNDGSFDRKNELQEITAYAKGKIFKIGFFATGENSANINYWQIDNILVKRQCAYPPGFEAFIDESSNIVELHWLFCSPDFDWLGYNDHTFENAFASANGGQGLGQLFVIDDFPTVEYPFRISKIRYYNSDYMNYHQQEEVFILSGDGSMILSGPYYINNASPDDWITILVSPPVILSSGDFMVATINTHVDGPFIGVDDSYYNETLFFGSLGDWTELGELGAFHYVGSHEALVDELDKDGNTVSSRQLSPASSLRQSNSKGTNDIVGANIYRSFNSGQWEQINDQPALFHEYFDTINENGEYCYYVTCLYDDCESDSSNNECVSYTVDIENTHLNDPVRIFPNPANKILEVECLSIIKSYSIFDQIGHKVKSQDNMNKKRFKINIQELANGIYFLHLESEKKFITRKFVVIK